MARNGSGTYNLPAGQPVATGTTISSTVHNTLASDIADEITNSLDKDGQTVITGALDFNGNEIILDVDGDTSITADTDDQIDIKIGGSDVITLNTSGFNGAIGATTPAAVNGTTGSFSGQTVVNTSGGSLVAVPSTFYDDLVVQNATSATGSGITILANATNGFGGVKFGDSGGANQFGVGYDCSTNRGFIDVAGSEALGFDSSRNAKFSNIVYIGSNDSYLQESGGDLLLGSGASETLRLTASDSALFSADVGVASGSILSVGYASASTSGASLQVNGDCAVDGELVLNEQYIQNTGISGTVWGLTIANTSSRSGINFIGPSSTSAQIAYGSNGGSIGNDDLAFEGFNEIFMNLPTSAGTTGSLWNDSGTVKVA